jgi:hypothetical protein
MMMLSLNLWKLIKDINNINKNKYKILPIIMLDLSWSMSNSNSAIPAIESTKEITNRYFNNGYSNV